MVRDEGVQRRGANIGSSRTQGEPSGGGAVQWIYEEAVRGRELQDGRLETLRGRASLILTGATVAVALFAGKEPPDDGWALALALAFLVLIISVTMVVLPRQWFEIPNLFELVENYVDSDDDLTEEDLVRDLVLIHADNWARNEAAMRRIKWWLVISVIGLGFVVALLTFGRA